MKIREVFSLGKREGAPCEDGWVVTENFAAVVDGSTSKIKINIGQESPGHLAMRLVCEAIRTMPAKINKKDALLVLTEAIASDHTYEASHYRPTCSAVIYSRYHKEIWFIGDCQARWLGKTYHFEKRVDKILTEIRCRAIHYYLEHGYSADDIRKHDKGRAFIFEALCDQLHFQNDPDKTNPYGYPVIDGQAIHAEQVPCLTVCDTEELILASDGYPTLHDTLSATEQHLADILTKDPLCINENPSSKCLVEGNRSFDDRTYLRIQLNDA